MQATKPIAMIARLTLQHSVTRADLQNGSLNTVPKTSTLYIYTSSSMSLYHTASRSMPVHRVSPANLSASGCYRCIMASVANTDHAELTIEPGRIKPAGKDTSLRINKLRPSETAAGH